MPEGDSIKKVNILYSQNFISQLSFVTQTGDFKVTGSAGVGDVTKQFIFDNDPYSFFGLIGTSVSKINSMGIVRLDQTCLNQQKQRQGSNFSWTASSATEKKQESESINTGLSQKESTDEDGNGSQLIILIGLGLVALLLVIIIIAIVIVYSRKNNLDKVQVVNTDGVKPYDSNSTLTGQVNVNVQPSSKPLRLELPESPMVTKGNARAVSTISDGQDNVFESTSMNETNDMLFRKK